MRVSKWTAAADDQCPLFVRHWQRPERPTALCATQLKPSWSWASSCHPLTGKPPFPLRPCRPAAGSDSNEELCKVAPQFACHSVPGKYCDSHCVQASPPFPSPSAPVPTLLFCLLAIEMLCMRFNNVVSHCSTFTFTVPLRCHLKGSRGFIMHDERSAISSSYDWMHKLFLIYAFLATSFDWLGER